MLLASPQLRDEYLAYSTTSNRNLCFFLDVKYLAGEGKSIREAMGGLTWTFLSKPRIALVEIHDLYLTVSDFVSIALNYPFLKGCFLGDQCGIDPSMTADEARPLPSGKHSRQCCLQDLAEDYGLLSGAINASINARSGAGISVIEIELLYKTLKSLNQSRQDRRRLRKIRRERFQARAELREAL